MAAIKQGIGVVNFEVYIDGTTNPAGIATVELPSVEYEAVDMKGNGIAGTVNMPIRANTASMELKLTWRTFEKWAADMMAHRSLDLSLYSVQEHYDGSTGEFSQPQHRIETRVVPKSGELGKWEPSSTTDSTGTFEIVTLNYFIDGVERLAFDKFNYICRINGRDYGEPVRKGLGL